MESFTFSYRPVCQADPSSLSQDVGYGKGKNYSVNVPLREGIDDASYKSIFEPVIQHIMDWYQPGAVVLQCGADSLSGDKLGSLNLSMKGTSCLVAVVPDLRPS